MKFEEYNVKTNESGHAYVKNNVIVSKEKKTCLICGNPTRFIETLSESYFCSDECVNAFYKYMDSMIPEF